MGRLPDKNDIEYILTNSRREEPLILEMEQYAREFQVPILDKISAKLLEQVVLFSRPQRILEIGTAIGYTSIRLAKYLPDGSTIDTVEIDKTMYEKASGFISRAEINSRINVIFDDAIQFLSRTDKTYDMIFLDCDKEVYPRLFSPIWKKLNTGGVFIADNLLWHGFTAKEEVPEESRISTEAIREFNKLFLEHEKLKSEILPVGDGIGIGIKLA